MRTRYRILDIGPHHIHYSAWVVTDEGHIANLHEDTYIFPNLNLQSKERVLQEFRDNCLTPFLDPKLFDEVGQAYELQPDGHWKRIGEEP